jgi:hypothetical protein
VVGNRRSSNRNDFHDITEILLKVALKTIKQTKPNTQKRIYETNYMASWVGKTRGSQEPVIAPVAQLEPNFDKIVIEWSFSKIVSGGPAL